MRSDARIQYSEQNLIQIIVGQQTL